MLPAGEKLKNNRIMNLKKLSKLSVIGLALCGSSVFSQVVNYTDGDLILDFSQAGANSDVEIDIGSLGSLTNLAQAAGGTVQISGTYYNVASQLLGVFPNLDNLSFSVFGLQLAQNGSVAANTSWLSQSQTGTSPNTPPHGLTGSNQNNLKAAEEGVLGLTATGNLGTKGFLPWSAANPSSANNTTNVAIISTSDISSFTHLNAATTLNIYVGGGHFQNTTSSTFATDGGSIVSDLFEFDPTGSSNPSVYRGYFTLNSDGTLYFSLPSPPSTTITSVSAGTGIVSVKFNTVTGVNYSLIYSTNLNLGRSSWTVIPGSVAGTGATGTLTDTTATNAARFYSVKSSF
jgi:hypothetical protein